MFKNKKRLIRTIQTIALVALAAVIVTRPELAFAQDAKSMIAKKGNDGFSLAYTAIVSVCGIGLIGAFGAGSFGLLEWRKIGHIAIGIVGIGLTGTLVTYLLS